MSFKALQIEQHAFDNFMRKFKKGKFGTQRLGQAFYNHFNLRRLTNQSALLNVWAKEGEHAKRCIQMICDFN